MPPLPSSQPGRPPRNPRVLAAFAYALPVVPAALMLARERRNRFVRLHAIQALIFYGLVALAQSVLYVFLVTTGNISHSLRLAVVLFCVFFALFAAVAVFAVATWLRLMRDALAGNRSRFAVISRLADWFERLLARWSRPSGRGATAKNSPAR